MTKKNLNESIIIEIYLQKYNISWIQLRKVYLYHFTNLLSIQTTVNGIKCERQFGTNHMYLFPIISLSVVDTQQFSIFFFLLLWNIELNMFLPNLPQTFYSRTEYLCNSLSDISWHIPLYLNTTELLIERLQRQLKQLRLAIDGAKDCFIVRLTIIGSIALSIKPF